jgi:hypothetical protein
VFFSRFANLPQNLFCRLWKCCPISLYIVIANAGCENAAL